MSTALCFNEITLSPVTHQNSLWIRAAELARALGYKNENSVSRLYRSNAEEFTPDMTQVIEMPVESRNGSLENLVVGRLRIFSLRGCHLIAMFARTPVAKQFRRWVLDVLDKLAEEERAAIAGNVKPIPQTTTRSTAADRAPLRALVHAWSQVAGVGHAALWPQVKAHFELSRIDDLPVEWLPDALAFVQGKIDGHQKALPAAPAPALPCAEPVLDPAVYLTGKRIFDMMTKLMTDFDLVKTHVQLWAHPGGRYARLSPELETIYQNAADASKMALCSLNQAQFALRIAMGIKAVHKFDVRGV